MISDCAHRLDNGDLCNLPAGHGGAHGGAGGGAHDWSDRGGIVCCSRCGMCRRADGKNKPCLGAPPGIVLRAEPLHQPPRDLSAVHAVRDHEGRRLDG